MQIPPVISTSPVFALFVAAILAALPGFSSAAVPISPAELNAPKIEISGASVILTVQPSVAGRSYQLQYSESMAAGSWLNLGAAVNGDGNNLVISTPYAAGVPRRFYRLVLEGTPAALEGFVLIPAGSFQMGDPSNPLVGSGDEVPTHTVQVSAFYMARHEVTKALWDGVRAWGLNNGYTDLAAGGGKGASHPVHSITWYDMVKWCNARSQMEGLTACYTLSNEAYRTGVTDAVVCNWSANGYRLPTEAEWEKAARGGLAAQNFPWGNTIDHSSANYRANSSLYAYDTSGCTVDTYHPAYNDGNFPYTSPVGSFAANGYGLYDMTGNVWEWCWDWYGLYTPDAQTDPRGSPTGPYRVNRGGSWFSRADYCRAAVRINCNPLSAEDNFGFRLARASAP